MFTALWIGDATLPEFAPAADLLTQRLRLTVVATVDDAIRGSLGEFDVAIIADAVPGGLSAQSLDALRRRHSGAPMVRLVGPLCDGELRTSPPGTTHRVRWLEAPAIFARDCDALEAGTCPSWGRPITRSAEEAALEASETSVARSPFAGLRIGIDADDPAVTAWLHQLTSVWGALSLNLRDSESTPWDPDVVLFQTSATKRDAPSAELRELRRRYAPSLLIVLGGFLRRETVDEYRSAGANGVAALPAMPDELEQIIANALQRGSAS